MPDAPKLYLARAGCNEEDEDLALENDLAIIDFRDIPSLEGAKDYDAVVQHVEDALPDQEKPWENLTRLVNSVLEIEGWVTRVSPPGPGGGVEILAGRGALGLDGLRLCVQVKSQQSPADVTVYRILRGTLQPLGAEQGLLVCLGGFNRTVQHEPRQSQFTARLWDSSPLVEAINWNYGRLPAEFQAELPLKQVGVMVAEDRGE